MSLVCTWGEGTLQAARLLRSFDSIVYNTILYATVYNACCFTFVMNGIFRNNRDTLVSLSWQLRVLRLRSFLLQCLLCVMVLIANINLGNALQNEETLTVQKNPDPTKHNLFLVLYFYTTHARLARL